jgi:HlyD family type I secretion membrane fusion protein
MRDHLIIDLSEATEARQALHARVPRIVHGTAILLVTLILVALTWMASTEANLVVRAFGRVRPLTTAAATVDFSEQISSEAGGRVIAVEISEGDEVRAGDVLLRLDAEALDNDIAKLRRAIESDEEEVTRLEQFDRLLAERHHAAVRKSEAELTEAKARLSKAEEERAVGIRLAQLELARLEADEARKREMAELEVVSRRELMEAVSRAQQQRTKLQKAQLAIDDRRVPVLEHALAMVHREYEVDVNGAAIRREAKRAELDGRRMELANLRLQRKRSTLLAPTDGIVTRVTAKVGDIVQPGELVMIMAQQRGFEFEAWIASEDVAQLKPGMPTRVKLDAYHYQRYGTVEGTLHFVSPDSQVREGVAIYKVRIGLPNVEFGRGANRGRVKLGMKGQAEIVTGRESVLMLLLRGIRGTISLG